MRALSSAAEGESEAVGFVGLGKIGFAMAHNMMKAGQSLLVYDADPDATARLVALGAAEGASASDVASRVSRIITVLPNDAVLKSVVLGADGVAGMLEALPAGGVHVSCSTVSPFTSRELAAMHSERGSEYVGAPVFARPDGMAAAQASIPISGAPSALARISPLLETTSTGVFEFGDDPGAANVVKLAGNFLIASAVESMSEALALAENNGVDRVKTMEMLNSTIFDCLIYKGYGQRVSERDHFPHQDAHFALELGLKDVTLVSDTAARSGVPMPVCSTLKDRYISAKARGWADLDWSAIGMSVSQDAGVDVAADVVRSTPKQD